MSLRIQDAGTLRTIKRLRIQQGGILRDIRRLRVMHGGVLRTVAVFADTLTASADPTSVFGTQSSANSIPVTSGGTTASPAGGRAPFTYAWAQLSGDAMTILSPTMATTQFRATVQPNTSLSGTFRCTITDAVGQTATADVEAILSNLGGGGTPL